ncbi:hypothetical protein NC651_008033 [Populus alba x Populus x berolinensis]|nr:hypothetical protein NC651_008033 [Populus alba x Populus x berolinensis]
MAELLVATRSGDDSGVADGGSAKTGEGERVGVTTVGRPLHYLQRITTPGKWVNCGRVIAPKPGKKDNSNKTQALAYVWSDKNEPNLYGEWDFKRLRKRRSDGNTTRFGPVETEETSICDSPRA